MSSTLYWEPVNRKKKPLGDEIKDILKKRLGGEVQGSLHPSDLQYLQGLRDAGIGDAQVLIEAIEKYGAISLTEEW